MDSNPISMLERPQAVRRGTLRKYTSPTRTVGAGKCFSPAAGVEKLCRIFQIDTTSFLTGCTQMTARLLVRLFGRNGSGALSHDLVMNGTQCATKSVNYSVFSDTIAASRNLMSTAVASAVTSYTRIYDVDVFISYGHIDNQEDWVTNFHSRLQTRLQELLGTSDVSIWRDLKLNGTEFFGDVIKAKVSHAALFISVLSPRYVASPSCQEELDLFMEAAGEGGGLRVDTHSRLI